MASSIHTSPGQVDDDLGHRVARQPFGERREVGVEIDAAPERRRLRFLDIKLWTDALKLPAFRAAVRSRNRDRER